MINIKSLIKKSSAILWMILPKTNNILVSVATRHHESAILVHDLGCRILTRVVVRTMVAGSMSALRWRVAAATTWQSECGPGSLGHRSEAVAAELLF